MRGLMPAADDRSLSRVDVAGRRVRNVLDAITTAQEIACRGDLDGARTELRSALRELSTIEALVQDVLDDLTRFSLLAERIARS